MKALFIISFVLIVAPDIFPQNLNVIDGKGQKQGKWLKTYPNGNTRYEGQFRDDHPYGLFKYYFETGQLEAETEFSEDGVIARTRSFYPNGTLKAEGKYIDQKRDSVWNYYRETDGKLIAKEEYNAGRLDGISTTYFPDSGKPAEVINYADGLKSGTHRKFYPDGQLMTLLSYVADTLDGEFESYYPNGKIMVKGTYSKGMQTGTWQFFDEEGNELTEEQYRTLPGTEVNDK